MPTRSKDQGARIRNHIKTVQALLEQLDRSIDEDIPVTDLATAVVTNGLNLIVTCAQRDAYAIVERADDLDGMIG